MSAQPSSADTPHPSNAGDDPATVFRALAELIYAGSDFTEIYRSLCNAAPRIVPGCDHASLMLKQGDTYATGAASSDVAVLIDTLEREIGEGPCVDAIEDEAAQLDSDLTDGSPWPKLTEQILTRTPVRGMAGFRLIAADRKVGALNLFSETPGALTEASADNAAMLAAFASVALLAATSQTKADTLRAGLHSNREIGKAIGLLMAFHKIDDDAAFALLRKASQDMNLKIAAIAREVIDNANRR